MIILEKCAVISCSKEVYEDEQRVLSYCSGHAWQDKDFGDNRRMAQVYGRPDGPTN